MLVEIVGDEVGVILLGKHALSIKEVKVDHCMQFRERGLL